ncbi:MAG: FAD-dependent oxidoreductase, partial [Pseudomonadota bacterium]
MKSTHHANGKSNLIHCDLCIIGAGSAGLSIAAGAVNMGARTVLIEQHKMGGDCLNAGCVPSKALLAVAKCAQTVARAERFTIKAGPPEIDWPAVRDHVQAIIATIEPNDSVERYQGMGVKVIKAQASFQGPRLVRAGDHLVQAKYYVIATGSTAFIPEIDGLDQIHYLTNETIFTIDHLPEHLAILGGGPIGCELAQAFRRLGAKVSVIQKHALLPRDDREAAAIVEETLRQEGVELYCHTTTTRITREEAGIRLFLEGEAAPDSILASDLLLATGRRPVTDGLGLDKAGVQLAASGAVQVSRRLRTNQRHIFAAGDVTGLPPFTHTASFHAGVLIRNLLLRIPAKADLKALPWVTYTDPELAQIGLNEDTAIERFGADALTILRWPYHENDRAIAECATKGFIKVICRKNGRVLGVTIVGSHAGELLAGWVDHVAHERKIGSIAGAVFPYPTLSELAKRAAGSFYTPT